LRYRLRLLGPHRDRLGRPNHTVQRLDADRDLSSLSIVIAGAQAVSNDRFVPAERRLDQRSTAIAGRFLPGHAAMFVEYLDMPVALSQTAGILREPRCPSRRNDDCRIISGLIAAYGLIDRIAVVGAVSEKMSDAGATRLEQRLNQIWIANIAVGQLVGNDLAALQIETNRELASATLALAVFFHTPFTSPENLQPAAVKHDIDRTTSR